MDKDIAVKFDHVTIPEELLYYITYILKQERNTKDGSFITPYNVLKFIVQNSPARSKINPDGDSNKGVIIKEIMDHFNLTRHTATEIIQLLVGATLICSKARPRNGIYWSATYRGFQIILFVEKNIVPSPQHKRTEQTS